MAAPPSFKSFAPSFSSFPDLDAPKAGSSAQKLDEEPWPREKRSRKEDKGARRDREGKEKRPRREGKDERRHHRSHRDERSDEKPRRNRDAHNFAADERAKAAEDARARSSAPELEKALFYSDKRGDASNVYYGRPDSKYVPEYRHVAGGRFILGLANGLVVQYRGSKGVEVGKRGVGLGRRKVPGLADAGARAMLKAPPTHHLAPSERAAKKYAPDADGNIRLSRVRREPADAEPAYRAIEPEKGSDASSSGEEDVEDADESEEEGVLPVTAYQERLLALQRAANAAPTLVEGWSALLAHMLSQVPLSSRGAVKARAEITLSVLERALRFVPGDKATPLRLLYLQAGEEVWDAAEQAAQWTRAMDDEHADGDTRAAWLEWRIRKAEGGLEGVLEDAMKAFDAAGTNEMEKLRLFWRVAVLLKSAGFPERALALFQAQAELTYHVPPALAGAFLASRLDKLEEFWDAEVPRAGEPGAQGWRAWLAAGKPPHTAPGAPAPAFADGAGDAYERWAHHEAAADRVVRAPLRTTDAGAEEDPYAAIMFGDVRPFLFTLSAPRARSAFRLAWLSLLGLHVPGFEASLEPAALRSATDDAWALQHLAAPSLLAALFPPIGRAAEPAAHAGVITGPEEHYGPAFGPIKSWAYRALGPLEGADLPPPGASPWTLWGARAVADVDASLVRAIFAACRAGAEDVEWDALALAFEAAAAGPKAALKHSRSFLAGAADALPRWAAHARLERLRGRPADARKVYETVLGNTLSTEQRLGAGALWADWAEMEWRAGDDAAAGRVLLRASGVDGDALAGVAVLRARKALAEARDGVPAPLWKAREAWARCAQLLELLVGGGAPAFVDDVAGGAGAESAAVAALALDFHVVVGRRGHAGDLRARLDAALRRFPDNTALLGMWLELQKGQGVWGRVQEVAEGVGVARRVAEVWMAGWVPARWEWEVERARAGLAEAVVRERTRGSAVLWQVWLALEVRAGDVKRAKDVLLQAIAACPLVKALYIPAFGSLRSAFTISELNSLAETMAERGLRMRRDLTEVMEVEGGGGDSGDESEGKEDEMLVDSAEYRRLKPYSGPY